MKWKKLGLVYEPWQDKLWSQLYAMMPTPIHLKDEKRIRVFYGTTDKERYGRTSFIDLHEDDPLNILSRHEDVILDLGRPGTFDDCGAIGSSIVSVRGKHFFYYVGFQRTVKVPYMLFSGLAIGTDLIHFKKYSEAPIIDRSKSNVFSNAAPFVLFDEEENIFKMWFWLGREWTTIKQKLYINAEIHYATSPDGLSWQLHKEPCIVPDSNTEFSVGRPWVIKERGRYRMFYSVRYVDKLYRLAYAESNDGITWKRKDNEIGIDVSEKGWDSEMVCYPAVITVKNKTYLFYNGNNNGETGFGIAELIEE